MEKPALNKPLRKKKSKGHREKWKSQKGITNEKGKMEKPVLNKPLRTKKPNGHYKQKKAYGKSSFK